MELTSAEKTKWARLKAEFIKRPFLAYKIGLSATEIGSYFSGIDPISEKVKEIDKLLLVERQKKVDRLRPTLKKIVGPRGSVHFAEKIDADGMTIKYILDNKSAKVPSHDLLSKIEIYLSYLTDFEVSVENLHDEKNFVSTKIDNLKLNVAHIISNLNNLYPYFETLKMADKKKKKTNSKGLSEKWQLDQLNNTLSSSIEKLDKIRQEVEVLVKDYSN